jgi:hypothetical protein
VPTQRTAINISYRGAYSSSNVKSGSPGSISIATKFPLALSNNEYQSRGDSNRIHMHEFNLRTPYTPVPRGRRPRRGE